MASSIDFNYTSFEQANLTPISGEPTFETLHKLQNQIKANAKSVYSYLGGGAYGHIGLVLTNAQYSLITKMLFFYLTHSSPIIIPDVTTDHMRSNMRIVHTKEVRLFRKVMGV